MSIRNSSRSAKAALLVATMAATFLVVFVITFPSVNVIRKDHQTQPTTESPTTISPTTQIECPLPTTDGGVDSRQLGNVIEGDSKNYTLVDQPVAMSHDGNRVVLGSPWGKPGDDVPEGPSTVKVFDFNENTWDEAGSFSGPNEDKYGRYISLSGDGKRLAIGAMWTDVGTDVGHVETYDFTEGTSSKSMGQKLKSSWKSIGQKLTGTNSGDLFGRSISLSDDGSRMAIGAIRKNGEDNGRVSVYGLEGDTWKRLGENIHGEAADDRFGIAVSLSGDGSILAVGARGSDEKGSESGSVRVFQYTFEGRTLRETQDKRYAQSSQETGKWVQVGQKLLGGASGDWFGYSLSISKNGNTLAIGAHHGNYVEVFHFDGNKWDPMGNRLIGKKQFGRYVFLAPSANRLAVGPNDGDGGNARIFDFIGNDWVEIGNIVSPSSEIFLGDLFA